MEAGVVIHEGQLTYGDSGLHGVVDLGAWWQEETGGPLPLGGNGIRRDLPEELKARLCRLLSESIEYGLAHRVEALDYALRYARGIEHDRARADRFVGMYVNEWTRDYGAAGRARRAGPPRPRARGRAAPRARGRRVRGVAPARRRRPPYGATSAMRSP